MKWLALTTTDGRVLRFSAMIHGLDSLAVSLHERAPGLRMDVRTAKMLGAARAVRGKAGKRKGRSEGPPFGRAG
jgi:hypothetical protein